MKFSHFPFFDFRVNTPIAWPLIAAILVLVVSGCAGKTQWVESKEPVHWADFTASRSSFETAGDAFELTQLRDPDPGTPLDESVSFDEIAPALNHSETIVIDRPAWAILIDDQREFYSRQNVRPAILTLGTAAIFANTDMDQEFSDWYQTDVRTESLDDIADVAKRFGEHWPMVGIYAGASLTGRWLEVDPRWASWGDQSLRSMFVGVPPLLFLQRALGSSRPNDFPPSSDWDFWADDNGASGHAFVGAVPFLVAAQLAERPRAKAFWLGLSTLTGWSRINDNDHYLSQVIVGWWLAYAATNAVERSDQQNFEIAPALIDDTFGFEATWRR